MQLPRESLWTVSSARPLYWLGPPYNRCDTNVRDQPDASRGSSVPHSGVTVWWSARLIWVRSPCDPSRKLSTSDSK